MIHSAINWQETITMEITVSDITLERTVERCFTFLRGAGTDARAFRALSSVGYSTQTHQTGWDLTLAVSGYKPPVVEQVASPEAVDAIRALDAEDGPLLSRLDASLRFNHPAQAAFVVGDLRAATGIHAVINVNNLLTRLGQLASEARAAQRDADLAALETLKARGIDDSYLDRLRALVAKAQSIPALADPPAADLDLTRQRQFAVYRWYFEWSRLARSVIKDARTLRRLGLSPNPSSGGRAQREDNPEDDADNL
jgi:hypothetical protein